LHLELEQGEFCYFLQSDILIFMIDLIRSRDEKSDITITQRTVLDD
jgi:hypothetical protein